MMLPSLGASGGAVRRLVCYTFSSRSVRLHSTPRTTVAASPGPVHVPTCTTLTHSCSGSVLTRNPQGKRKPFVAVCGDWATSLHTSSVEMKEKNSKRIYVRGSIQGQQKKHPILKHPRVMLIDEKGTSHGEMDSQIALGVAEGRGLQMKVVGAESEKKSGSVPIFKLYSQKSDYEMKKAERKTKKRLHHDTLKEIKIGTKITEHDLEVKLKHMRTNLEKGYSLHVIVMVNTQKYRRMPPEKYEEELRKREVILDSVTKNLSDIAKRAKDDVKNDSKDTEVSAIFRAVAPIVKAGEPAQVEDHTEEQEV